MKRRSIIVLAAAAVVVGSVGVGVAVTAIRAAGYPQFWAQQAEKKHGADAVRIVAMGDSATVAVGALDPLNGFVGRIAQFVGDETGHPVHIQNAAVGGATAGAVLAVQVPQYDLMSADLVILCTSNDLEQRVPLTQYRADLEAILSQVPAERTVVSDLPLEPGRAPYQSVLAEVADRYNVARADFATVFNGPGQRLDIFSLLPPHLNDRGYQYWYEAFRPPVESIIRRDSPRFNPGGRGLA